MWGWYKDAVELPPPPDRVAITTMTEERVELFQHFPSPVQPIPVGVNPFLVKHFILEDKEIDWVAHRLCLNRNTSASGCKKQRGTTRMTPPTGRRLSP